MKTYTFLLLLLLAATTGHSQPTPLDTVHRKVWITGMAGANTFLQSPVMGVAMAIEITDAKYPLLISWTNGFMLTKNKGIFLLNLSVGKRFDKVDVGISPIGFMGYLPQSDFVPTMGIFTTLRPSPRLSFNMAATYNYSYHQQASLGFNATLNYKLIQLKKL